MLVRSKSLSIPVGERGSTSAVLLTPSGEKKDVAVIIAHGAGNDLYNPLLSAFAEGLSRGGYPALRFNFLYREQGRKMPDKEEILVETWQAAFRFMKESSGLQKMRVVAAGKSLGGRIASQAAAEGVLPVAGLIFLGYPLHPSTDKEKMRDSHLYRIGIPMLFFAGTRDLLCDLDRLKRVLGRLRADWDLMVIEGGDHSFHVPRSTGIDDEEIYKRIVEKTLEWLGHS
jgi:hypothetical protein